jgi:hypothetical protein
MEKVHARSLAELVSIAERLDMAGPEVGAGAAGTKEPETLRGC